MLNHPNITSDRSAISESDFLAEQADRAKTAAVAALQEAKVALEKNLDPRPVLKDHPLISIGAAALAGFVAVMLAIPSKEERELRRLERIHRATHPQAAGPAASNGDAKNNGHAAPLHSPIWSSIVHEIVQLIRPILMTAITAGIKSATNPPPPVRDDETPNPPT